VSTVSLRLDEVVQRLFEHVAGDVRHDLAEHLRAPVRVMRKRSPVCSATKVVETEVEDVHHRASRTGRQAHRHEQRISSRAERAPTPERGAQPLSISPGGSWAADHPRS
jgi:hypothetical protein